MSDKDILLRTAESRQRDVGRGRVRINDANMRKIDISPGDIVELFFKNKKIGATAWLAYKEDQNSDIIRIDGIIRRNLSVRLNENIIVRKANAKIAEKVTLIPMEDIALDSTLKQFIKQKLSGYPVITGDLVLIQLLVQA